MWFVYSDYWFVAEFGTLEWSPDETKIVYIAEKKVPKSEPFYKQKPKASADKSGVDKSDTVPVCLLIIFTTVCNIYT